MGSQERDDLRWMRRDDDGPTSHILRAVGDGVTDTKQTRQPNRLLLPSTRSLMLDPEKPPCRCPQAPSLSAPLRQFTHLADNFPTNPNIVRSSASPYQSATLTFAPPRHASVELRPAAGRNHGRRFLLKQCAGILTGFDMTQSTVVTDCLANHSIDCSLTHAVHASSSKMRTSWPLARTISSGIANRRVSTL